MRWRRKPRESEQRAAEEALSRAGRTARPPAHAEEGRGPRPALPVIERRAVLARARAAGDPGQALAALLAASSSYAPDPFLLHALCLALKDAGQETAAVAVAREALPLCFRERQGLLAAEILEAVDAEPETLGASRTQLLALGGALAETSLWPLAVKLLAALALRDPGDHKAVRDLLRIAAHRRSQQDAAEAARIERFVLLLRAQAEEERAPAAVSPDSPRRSPPSPMT